MWQQNKLTRSDSVQRLGSRVFASKRTIGLGSRVQLTSKNRGAWKQGLYWIPENIEKLVVTSENVSRTPLWVRVWTQIPYHAQCDYTHFLSTLIPFRYTNMNRTSLLSLQDPTKQRLQKKKYSIDLKQKVSTRWICAITCTFFKASFQQILRLWTTEHRFR